MEGQFKGRGSHVIFKATRELWCSIFADGTFLAKVKEKNHSGKKKFYPYISNSIKGMQYGYKLCMKWGSRNPMVYIKNQIYI